MSDVKKDERGYELFISYLYATRRTRFYEAEFDLSNPDGLRIKIEQGSGYLQQSCDAFIHIDVLIDLLKGAGYHVEKVKPPPVM
jgi:hypothetical protein